MINVVGKDLVFCNSRIPMPENGAVAVGNDVWTLVFNDCYVFLSLMYLYWVEIGMMLCQWALA